MVDQADGIRHLGRALDVLQQKSASSLAYAQLVLLLAMRGV